MAHIALEHPVTPGWAHALLGLDQFPEWPVKQFAGPGDAMKPDTDDELINEDEEDDDDEFEDDDEDLTDDDDEAEDVEEEAGR
jgi:hypothetical protein